MHPFDWITLGIPCFFLSLSLTLTSSRGAFVCLLILVVLPKLYSSVEERLRVARSGHLELWWTQLEYKLHQMSGGVWHECPGSQTLALPWVASPFTLGAALAWSKFVNYD